MLYMGRGGEGERGQRVRGVTHGEGWRGGGG